MATVRELARMLGVSPSTVSRALRGADGVGAETATRIRNTAQALQMGPSRSRQRAAAVARSGAVAGMNQIRPIACIIANPVGSLNSDLFFSDIISAVSSYAGCIGRTVLVETTEASSRSRIPEPVVSQQVDGCIVGGIPMSQHYIDSLIATGVPCVFIGKYLGGRTDLSAVIPDNVSGGRLVGRHLAESGYEEFAFLGGDLSIQTFADRHAGFVAGLADMGASLRQDFVMLDEIDHNGGYNAMTRLLDAAGGCRLGVFASTDWMAAGALRLLNERSIGVPTDVGLVGYSDLELAAHLYPSLTSVRVRRDTVGLMAARTLLDIMEGRIAGPVQVILQPELVVRESSCTARGVGEVEPT